MEQVTFLRLSVPSASSNRARVSAWRRPASRYPASAFVALAVLAPPVFASGRRLPLFSEGGSVSIMRHRPLSRWRSAIEPDWLSVWSIDSGCSTHSNRHRSWDFSDPSQRSSCFRVKTGSPTVFLPRLPFHRRAPRPCFFAGDRSPDLALPKIAWPINHGRLCRLPGFSCCNRMMIDLGRIAPSMLPWAFPLSGIRPPDLAGECGRTAASPSNAARSTDLAIRSWVCDDMGEVSCSALQCRSSCFDRRPFSVFGV